MLYQLSYTPKPRVFLRPVAELFKSRIERECRSCIDNLSTLLRHRLVAVV